MRTYLLLYDIYCTSYPEITHTIYLKVDTLTALNRIKQRNRNSEQGINIEYLDNLNNRLESMVSNIAPNNVSIIDISNISTLNAVSKIKNIPILKQYLEI